MSAWYSLGKPLVLASKSPRRRELLERMGLEFEVIAPDIGDEDDYIEPSNLNASLQELARKKADQVAAQYPDAYVVGGDTIVCLQGVIMGKPISRRNAFDMLKSLSGRVHEVISGVGLICRADGFSQSNIACTKVHFRSIPDDEINRYLDFNEFADKAGAYGIQGKALTFVESIEGCYYNVVGLPITETIELLKKAACERY